MNKTHAILLREIAALHEKKASDYAASGDPYSNFRKAAQIAEGFHGVDAVFATLIGVKIARIAELTQPGRSPKNESLDDSFVDLTNYCAIWASFRRDSFIPPPVFANDLGDVNESSLRSDHTYYPAPDGVCLVCGSVGAH